MKTLHLSATYILPLDCILTVCKVEETKIVYLLSSMHNYSHIGKEQCKKLSKTVKYCNGTKTELDVLCQTYGDIHDER